MTDRHGGRCQDWAARPRERADMFCKFSCLKSCTMEGRSDVNLSRYVPKFSTNRSPYSIAFIPSAGHASRSGSHGKPPKQPLQNRIHSLAHHAVPLFAIRNRMLVSPPSWTCISRPIQVEAGAIRKKRRRRVNTMSVTAYCRGSQGSKKAIMKRRIEEWSKRLGN